MEVPSPSSALLPAGWRRGGGATPGRRSPGGMEESGAKKLILLNITTKLFRTFQIRTVIKPPRRSRGGFIQCESGKS